MSFGVRFREWAESTDGSYWSSWWMALVDSTHLHVSCGHVLRSHFCTCSFVSFPISMSLMIFDMWVQWGSTCCGYFFVITLDFLMRTMHGVQISVVTWLSIFGSIVRYLCHVGMLCPRSDGEWAKAFLDIYLRYLDPLLWVLEGQIAKFLLHSPLKLSDVYVSDMLAGCRFGPRGWQKLGPCNQSEFQYCLKQAGGVRAWNEAHEQFFSIPVHFISIPNTWFLRPNVLIIVLANIYQKLQTQLP